MTPDELLALAEKATAGPWCIETCGEKGDGSYMIGVAFDSDDVNCERPMSGWIPLCRPLTGEFIEYYRDELVAECEHRNNNSANNAAFIAACREGVPALCEALRKAEARVKRLEDFARRMANTGGVLLDVRKLARTALEAK